MIGLKLLRPSKIRKAKIKSDKKQLLDTFTDYLEAVEFQQEHNALPSNINDDMAWSRLICT